MILNKKSLHFRLAAKYGSFHEWDERTDLCSYTRSIMSGLFVIAVITLVGVLFAGMLLVAPAIHFLACLNEGRWLPLGHAALFGIIGWSGAALAAAIIWGVEGGPRRFMPEPVREAYRGWKEKYCPVVELRG